MQILLLFRSADLIINIKKFEENLNIVQVLQIIFRSINNRERDELTLQ